MVKTEFHERSLNGQTLGAIREKLGDFANEAPQMTKAEAQQFSNAGTP